MKKQQFFATITIGSVQCDPIDFVVWIEDQNGLKSGSGEFQIPSSLLDLMLCGKFDAVVETSFGATFKIMLTKVSPASGIAKFVTTGPVPQM